MLGQQQTMKAYGQQSYNGQKLIRVQLSQYAQEMQIESELHFLCIWQYVEMHKLIQSARPNAIAIQLRISNHRFNQSLKRKKIFAFSAAADAEDDG